MDGLDGLPCELVRVDRGDEALRALAAGDVVVAVVAAAPDENGWTGYDLARQARGALASRGVPFIFVAPGPVDAAPRGFDPGTFDVVPAPVDHRLLRSKVQLFLDLAAARRRLLDESVAHGRVAAELETFHHAVAHDLRASLRPLDGLSEALLDDYGDNLDGQEKDYLGRIKTAAGRMERLIDDLVQLARVGHAAMHRHPVDLSAMVAAIVEDLRAAHPDARLDLVTAPGLKPYADGRLLRIAIDNLLRSGRLRTPKQIEVGRQTGDEPVYFIRDVDRSRGINQAIVDRVIHRHDGRTWTEPSSDRGATFYFTLPDDRH